MKKKKRSGCLWALSMALGFVCALVLGALFYGTMLYQLSAQDAGRTIEEHVTPAPLDAQASAAQLFPGPLLSLGAELKEERAADETFGGQICRVIYRTYALEDGSEALALSAAPAAYFERLSREGFKPELITGFTLAGLDAVCYTLGGQKLLAAREGGRA